MKKRAASKLASRYKQNRRIYLVDGLVVVAVLGSIGIAIFGAGNQNESPYACEQVGTNHRLQLKQDTFSQSSIVINRCDTLTIENKDTLSYNLNFGKLNQHSEYPGYRAVTMLPTESITIDAVQAGAYELHDHFRDRAQLKLDIRDNK
jgi:hypothetical protein